MDHVPEPLAKPMDARCVLQFLLAAFKDTPKDAALLLHDGATTHVVPRGSHVPLDVLASAAAAGRPVAFSPALRDPQDTNRLHTLPLLWVHLPTDTAAQEVARCLDALPPTAVVPADGGVDIYWRAAQFSADEIVSSMRALADALGGAALALDELRPLPLRFDVVVMNQDAPIVDADALARALPALPALARPLSAGVAPADVVHDGTETADVDDTLQSDPDGAAASTHDTPGIGALEEVGSDSPACLEDEMPREGGPRAATGDGEVPAQVSFSELTTLAQVLAETQHLHPDQAYLVWAVREAHRQFGQRLTLEQLNLDSIFVLRGRIVVRRGHRYYTVGGGAEGGFHLEPMPR